MKRILGFFVFVSLLSSCVSTKRLTYLQEEKEQRADTNKIYQLQRSNYALQPNDIVSIVVRSFDQETAALFNISNFGGGAQGGQGGGGMNNGGDMMFYMQGYPVSLDGKIQMPIIGVLDVSGKTIDEIQGIVETKLNEYFVEDAVFVTVRLAGVRFTVIGEVNNPGRFVIFQNQVNIFEAVNQSGGITMVGDRREVMILRQTKGGISTYYLDLTDADVLSDPYFFIQPNDIINIQPLPQKSWGIGTTGFQTFASLITFVASGLALYVALSN